MKRILIPLLSLAALAVAVGCNSTSEKSANETTLSDSTNTAKCAQHAESLYGTYCGIFPCADCPGKRVELTIMEDSVYTLAYSYLECEENPDIIEECGTYHVINDTLIETITPSSNEKTYYVYTNGNMVLSDSVGTIDNGVLADFYVLKKDTITEVCGL